MRTAIFFGILAFSTNLVAQTTLGTVDSASLNQDLASGPGMYSLPFVPQVSTPSMELTRPSLRVGASNSTGTNVTGAQASTTAVLPQQNQSPLVTPRLAGAQISEDIYPRN